MLSPIYIHSRFIHFFKKPLLLLLKILPIILISSFCDFVLNNDLNFLIINSTINEKTPNNILFLKALCDNIGHGLTAVFVWLMVINYDLNNKWNILNTILCGFVGSIIDLDHFWKAHSYSLKVTYWYLFISCDIFYKLNMNIFITNKLNCFYSFFNFMSYQ